MSPIPSLLSSFTKVYIQSRLSDSIDSKRRSLVILKETVASGAVGSSCIALDNLVRLSTLKTSDIYLDPCLAIIKQRCAVLSAISNAEENDLVKVIQFLGLKASARNVCACAFLSIHMFVIKCNVLFIVSLFFTFSGGLFNSINKPCSIFLSSLLS